MPTLYLPQSMHDEANRDKAEAERQLHETTSMMAEFNKELRLIDPYLRMVLARPHTEPDSPFKGGYYHVIRDAPDMPLYVTPLEWANGDYREPGSWVYEHLQHEDLWNDRAQKARAQRREALRTAEAHRKDREALARAEDYTDRYNHALNTQISVSKAIH